MIAVCAMGSNGNCCPHTMADYARECGQCQYMLPVGRRCRARTCDRYPFCWQHMKKKWGLVAKPSTIAGAGLGLFFVGYKDEDTGERVEELRKGTTVAWYSGKDLLTEEEYHARYPADVESAYGLCFGRGRGTRCLDSGPTANLPGRLANDSAWFPQNGKFVRRNPADPTWPKANVKFYNGNAAGVRYMYHRHAVPMKATRKIRAGEELFVEYGDGYWEGE